MVTDLLVEHFPKVMDLKFTRHMEEELDEIEARQDAATQQVLDEFWGPFSEALEKAETKMPRERAARPARSAPSAASRWCKQLQQEDRQQFVGCSGYHGGASTSSRRGRGRRGRSRSMTEHTCPKCGKPMMQRMGRRGHVPRLLAAIPSARRR